MAASQLTVQQIAQTGVVPTYTSADTNGNYFSNNGYCFLHVKNASGGSINVTIVTPVTQSGLALADQVVAVAAGAEKMIGPFAPATFNDSSDVVNVTYSAVTSITVGVFRLQ